MRRAVIPFRYSMRSLGRRWGSTLLCAVIFAAEVLMILSFVGLYRGTRGFIVGSADPRNLILMQPSVSVLEHSRIDQRFIDEARSLGLGTVTADLVFPELGVDPRHDWRLPVRGVDESAPAMRGIHWRRGRRAQAPDEAALGELAARSSGIEIGERIVIAGRAHEIVGMFAGADAYSSEVWVDLEALQALTSRVGNVSTVTLQMEDASRVEPAREAIERDKRFAAISVRAEKEYFEAQAQQASLFVILGTLFGATLGLGVFFGSANSMVAMVDDRRTELAVLRALGFSKASIFSTLLGEILSLAGIGGAVGATVAMLLRGVSVRQMTPSFRSIEISPALQLPDLLIAIAGVALLACAAGLAPAIHASRIQAARVLRR